MLTRVPGAALRPLVKRLWVADEAARGPGPLAGCGRELVLPTGTMHLALRLSETPLRVFEGDAEQARTIGTAVVGGARARAYLRDVSLPVRTIGAQLEPGMGALLLGVPADELSGQHTALEALWGSAAERMRAQLAEVRSPAARLELFERLLLARVSHRRGLHPAVAEGIAHLAQRPDVAAAAAASGYSHRRFTSLFQAAVGLPPKLFCRVRRFEHTLAQLARAPHSSWSALALSSGYSDQAHFSRDFREFAGLTPSRYRALAPQHAHHVLLPFEES